MSIGMVSLPIFDSLANRPLIHQTVRNSWVIGLAFTLIFAVYELGSGNHFESSDSERILGGSDLYVPFASVFFGNYNNYCAYICLAFPMGLWVLYDTDSAKAKCGVFFILLLAALIVTVNTSRAAMILIALYVAAFSLRNFKFRFRHIFWIIGICIILYTALNNELLGTLVKYRMSNFLGEGDESTRLRLSVFMAGVDMVVQTYGFGVGAGGFTTEILASKYYEDLVDPHNLIIELTSQYGIFSFLFFLNWLSMIYRQATRNNFISPNAKLSVHISLLAVPIIGIMNSHALGYTYWWVFFSGLTLISGYDSGNARKIVKVPNNPI